ncbi:hypothetical protein HD553DRAFT_327748 [Filobasidium floriforme]|uniref:uncharacterized protein n=1 Tax=Filobasidium floriforme TaxID=5210 RepID=UPI001E8EE39C|nr:uncharacterized protein HD553DRAFT_327748 [Filobasidium floriforme]KAH8089703.1 hypothetical protein HD553DRAFT_327748 [Filobasidium floriforme]
MASEVTESNPYYNGGGGGFVGGGANGSPYGSQNSPGTTNKKGGQSTLRPVTIKQIIGADQPHPDADFQIDGVDVGSVRVVGVVRNISRTATNVSYTIEDGTGEMSARVWLDTADDDNGKTGGIEQDTYVSVLGVLKSFGGKRHISAQNIRRVEDFNEVHYHLLEALYISLTLRNPNKGMGGAASAPARAGNTHADYLPGGNNNAQSGDDDRWANQPTFHRAILKAIEEHTVGEDGVHVGVVAKNLGSNQPQEQIM